MVIYHDYSPGGWNAALLFSPTGFWMDFFRIKIQRRGVGWPPGPDDLDLGGPPNILFGWNEYEFKHISHHGHPV